MSTRLQRSPPRQHLCTTNDGEAISHINGTAVVWWYERAYRNDHAQSIPVVDIVFRFLDKFDQLSGITKVKIGMGRLGSFRLGTLWKNGRCVAETNFGDDQEFTVDFTRDAWTYLSLKGNHDYPFFKKGYELPHSNSPEVLSELLNFPLPGGKNLLIPCMEFLYRCYGSTSDMARILATYSWPEVQEKLYASLEHDAKTWLVQPKRHIPEADALFLASVQYDPYAERAARNIHSQLDNAHGLGMAGRSLKVSPWFQGLARVKGRGCWINGGKTFLCLEVTGLSQPQQNAYELRLETRGHLDITAETPAVNLHKHIENILRPDDRLPVTDEEEPGYGASRWSKQDPCFEILGPKCAHKKIYVQRNYSEIKNVQVPEGSATRASTGDPNGPRNDACHIVHHATRVEGDGGILQAIWNELRTLKTQIQAFSSLAWYCSAKMDFVETPVFRLHKLPSFREGFTVPDAARTWLFYRENPTKIRGILIVRLVIHQRTFYLFENQRKKKLRGNAYHEEKVSGLLMNIDDPQKARETISMICDRIRYAKGRFGRLKNLEAPHKVFRHYAKKNTFAAALTVQKSFESLGIDFSKEHQTTD